jgi:hypothetical protein
MATASNMLSEAVGELLRMYCFLSTSLFSFLRWFCRGMSLINVIALTDPLQAGPHQMRIPKLVRAVLPVFPEIPKTHPSD